MSCVHVAAWPTRFTHAAFPAIEDMLLNVSAWKRLFDVDLAAGAKLVMVHHAQTPVSGGLVEWEQYPLPASVYQAPHVIWAKISSRTWYQLGVNTRNAAAYRPGLDISFPPSAQAVAAKVADDPQSAVVLAAARERPQQQAIHRRQCVQILFTTRSC